MSEDLLRVLVASGEGKLLSLRFDPESGTLNEREEIATGGQCPSFVALNVSAPVAYVANEGSSQIAVVDLERRALTALVPSGGEGPAYVAMLPGSAGVVAANYGGGTVATFLLSDAGTALTPARSVELGPNPHAALADESGRFLIVPALGADAVFVCELADKSLRLVSRCDLPRGSGPRHLVFARERARAYLVCEHTSELAVLDWDADEGVLSVRERVSLLPPSANCQGNTGADVHLHPNGKYLYASNRGHDSIAVFSLEGDSPRLLGHQPTAGHVPRNFALSPDGRYLLVANLKSASVAAFRVMPDGLLELLRVNDGIEQPFWVGFGTDKRQVATR